MLVVDELETTLSQTFTVFKNNRLDLVAIRPYILSHNSPAGTFTFKLLDGATTLFSDTFTAAELKTDISTANDYVRIWKNFSITVPTFLENGDYTLELSSSGYTYSDASYLGWIKEHEHLTNVITNDDATSALQFPRSFQLLTRQDSI